jgi:hypothetical protein
MVNAHASGGWRRVVQGAPRRVVLSGRFGVLLQDGTVLELGPDDVYDIASEHDGYTIGDEPCVVIEWSGLRAFAGFQPAHTVGSW